MPTRLRHRHRKKINGKSHLIQTDALAAENAGHKDPVKRTDDLHNESRDGQNKSPLEKGFSLSAFPSGNIDLRNEKHRLS